MNEITFYCCHPPFRVINYFYIVSLNTCHTCISTSIRKKKKTLIGPSTVGLPRRVDRSGWPRRGSPPRRRGGHERAACAQRRSLVGSPIPIADRTHPPGPHSGSEEKREPCRGPRDPAAGDGGGPARAVAVARLSGWVHRMAQIGLVAGPGADLSRAVLAPTT